MSRRILAIFLGLSLPACALDGKAVSWSDRRERAEEACRERGGLRHVDYNLAVCRDGSTIRGIN